MSIMIKGIDMPINCTRCPCSDDETRFCRAANKYIPMLGKPNFCPLEVVAIWSDMEAEERKKGQWTNENACEFCGFQPWYERDIHTLSFCPNCGADMRGEGNG